MRAEATEDGGRVAAAETVDGIRAASAVETAEGGGRVVAAVEAVEGDERVTAVEAAEDGGRAAAVEAVLMVAIEPVAPDVLGRIVGCTPAEAEDLCDALADEYAAQKRGFVLARVAGGYRYQTAPDQAGYVERFVTDERAGRLSAAAMETLAIVAYKQPVSRNQIAAIRGVNADGVVRTLVQRGFIDEVDRHPGPGQAVLYGTTSMFLECLGLDSVDDLPDLGDFVADPAAVEALEAGLRAGGDGAGGSKTLSAVPDPSPQ